MDETGDGPEALWLGKENAYDAEDILGELIHVWVWVGVPALALALAAGLLLANRSIRPVKLINRALAEKTPATLKAGIPLPEKDRELAELVSQINSLMFRVGDTYDEMSALSTRVAHELRTPLALLRMRIERSAEEIPPDLSEELQDELARLSRFVERSLLAAKAQAGRIDARRAPVGLSEVLEDLREPYEILAEQANIATEWDVAPGLRTRDRPAVGPRARRRHGWPPVFHPRQRKSFCRAT